jgi:hypothetical protein
MNWIKVPNSQFIRILEKCPDRDSNQGSIGYIRATMEAVRTSETSVNPTRLHGAISQKALIF